MNWIKQNKFLTSFIAVMVIGVGVLGYLLFSAKSHYDEVQSTYESKVHELSRLEHLKPYPEIENLKQFDEQKKQHAAAIEAFRKNLAVRQISVEPMTPEKFQDELRETVTRLTTAASEKGVKVPGEAQNGQTKFYLGFEKYQTEPPKPDAAPVLGRELKAMEMIIGKLIELGITSIDKLERDPLPEEEGKVKKEPAAKPGAAPGREDKVSKGLVVHHGIRVELTSEQSRVRNLLNAITASKEQFFIPRLVLVKNEKEAAPAREVARQDDPKGKKQTDLKYIFGAEKLNIALHLEMVDFPEAAAK